MSVIDNMACVIAYFDEEQQVPADYVLKWSNDFEAFVAKIEDDTLDSVSIGRFASLQAAIEAIWRWNGLENNVAS